MKINPWIKTSLLAALGGGIAGVAAAATNPALYRFPQDLGSGKMWIHFFTGAAVTFGALCLKSPVGQKVMLSFKDSQTQLEQSKADLAAARESIKPSNQK